MAYATKLGIWDHFKTHQPLYVEGEKWAKHKKAQNNGHTIRPIQKIRESEFETTFLLVPCKEIDQIDRY